MPLIPDEESVMIVERLVERTRAKTLAWDTYAKDVAEYRAHTPHFLYYIRSRDDDELAPYVLQIWRRIEGRSVHITDIETQANGSVNESLSLLYGMAKLQALGIDSLKDDILRDLE